MDERWLSVEEAAKIAGVSTKTIRRAIMRGELRRSPCHVRRVLIKYSDLVQWMDGTSSQNGRQVG